jgi:SPP1 gp7 family putative phage head morphogenesis protein
MDEDQIGDRMRITIGALDIKFGNQPGDAVGAESLNNRLQNAQLPTAPQGKDPFPFKPLAPLPPLGGPGPEPTGFEIPVGYNLTFNPDQAKPGARESQLRILADNCWGIRLVIEDLKRQMRGLPHGIRPLKMQEGEKYAERPDVQAAEAWLKKPDGYLRFGDWLNAVLEDILVVGAVALGKRRTVGGKPLGLRVMDAAKIKPILTAAGLPPDPPAAAFYQYLHGVPERQYTTDELIWRPMNARSWTPYGFSAVEQCLTLVTLAINASLQENYSYTAGNTPPGWLILPKDFTMQQREDFQRYLDSRMKGNLQARAAAIAVPDGTTYIPVPPPKWDYEFDELILRAMAWVVGVNPEPIMKSAGLGRSGQGNANQSQASGIEPHEIFIEEILDEYINEDLGLTEVSFEWIAETQINKQLELQENEAFVKLGIRSVNEARARAGDPPSDVPEANMLMVLTPTGYVPLQGSSKTPPEAPPPEAPPENTQKADLARWKKVAKADAKNGRTPRPFVSAAITPAARYWVEKCLAEGDVAKAFKGPRKALRWETSERAKPLTEAGVELWQRIYRHLAAPYLAEGKAQLVTKGPTDMPPEDWAALVRWLEAVYNAGVDDSAELVGVGETSAAVWAQERAAALLGMKWDGSEWIDNPNELAVSDTVRETVRNAIAEAVRSGKSYTDLAKELQDTLESPARAMVTARTETAVAYNVGAGTNYAAQGVERVEVSDGNGPGSCAECDAVNGEIWTVDEMIANPIEHPNCTRAFIPLSEE